jgi:hypothetical protein
VRQFLVQHKWFAKNGVPLYEIHLARPVLLGKAIFLGDIRDAGLIGFVVFLRFREYSVFFKLVPIIFFLSLYLR